MSKAGSFIPSATIFGLTLIFKTQKLLPSSSTAGFRLTFFKKEIE
jgi:hypothetical protein